MKGGREYAEKSSFWPVAGVVSAWLRSADRKQSPLSKQEQFIMSVKSFYISQYKDYEYLALDPSKLSEEQKIILRKKKEILVQVKPLIDTYDAMLKAGQTPTLAQEQAIIILLNQIGGAF